MADRSGPVFQHPARRGKANPVFGGTPIQSSPLGVCHAPQDCDGNPCCWRVVNVRNLGTSCEATASGCVPEMGVDTLTNPPLRDGWRLHLRRHHHRADALLPGVGPFLQGMCRGVSRPLSSCRL